MSKPVDDAVDGRNRQSDTSVERQGERDLAIARSFTASLNMVYRAWSEAELFQRWWFPRSVTGIRLVSCDLDVRTGGAYRLEFAADGAENMAFYGRYIDVTPNEMIVWTNEEGEDGAITTVTFEDQGASTLLTYHEAYPSTQAREEALQGSAAALPEQFDQLADLLSRFM